MSRFIAFTHHKKNMTVVCILDRYQGLGISKSYESVWVVFVFWGFFLFVCFFVCLFVCLRGFFLVSPTKNSDLQKRILLGVQNCFTLIVSAVTNRKNGQNNARQTRKPQMTCDDFSTGQQSIWSRPRDTHGYAIHLGSASRPPGLDIPPGICETIRKGGRAEICTCWKM